MNKRRPGFPKGSPGRFCVRGPGSLRTGDDSAKLLRALAWTPTDATGADDPGLPALPGVDIRIRLCRGGVGPPLRIVGRYSNGVDVLDRARARRGA